MEYLLQQYRAVSNSAREGYNLIPAFPSYGATEAYRSLPADPSKIEPKVFLASERTFLNWLRVSLLLSSFALTLFNTSPVGDWVGKGMGLVYIALAFAMGAYAWKMQERRRERIITRYAGHHGKSSSCSCSKNTPKRATDHPILDKTDEIYGPVVLCAAVFGAVLLNFILRVNQR